MWQKCCGFVDLSPQQFMNIQYSLLLEQISLLKRCRLGRRLLGGFLPDSVDEFRNKVPLSSYRDYYPDLFNRRADILPARPVKWIRGLGSYDEYPAKLIPVTERCWEEMQFVAAAAVIFASGKKRGELNADCLKTLLWLVRMLDEHLASTEPESSQVLDLLLLPCPQKSAGFPFEEQLRENYKLVLREGMCAVAGKAWLLAAIGQYFEFTLGELKHPSRSAAFPSGVRLVSGLLKSRLAGHPLLPRDLWKVGTIISTGPDRIFYRDKIRRSWGAAPLHVYGSTETLIVAMQTWDRSALTFVPQLNFLEFIPEREYRRNTEGIVSQLDTVLLHEVTAGESYELVITNFHGGALVRYRTGDIVRITSPGDRRYGINTPQMVFERKTGAVIDLGYMYITEKVLNDAIADTQIPVVNWTARKEIHEQKPVLHLYIELQQSYIASETGMAAAVYKQLLKLNRGCISKDLNSLEKLTGISPVKVTLLPTLAFHNYAQRRRQEGPAEIPEALPHINPTDKMLALLGAKARIVAEIKASINSPV